MERKAGENTIFTYIKSFFLCLLPLVTLKQLVFDQKTVEPSDLKETLALIPLTLYNFISESNIKTQE